MNRKKEFTKSEVDKLRELIGEKCNATPDKQKTIRNKMRNIGFYASDFNITDMNIEKFEGLIKEGRIKITSNRMDTNHLCVEDRSKISLPPMIDEDSEILVLGTIPGDKSLEKREYYASSRNSFWKIIYKLFRKDGEEFKSYEEKLACLKEHHIALWDVFACCKREGSTDGNIMEEELNDIDSLLKRYPNIRKIICNGQKASTYLSDIKIEVVVAESTSGTNAKKIEVKIEDWKSKLEV